MTLYLQQSRVCNSSLHTWWWHTKHSVVTVSENNIISLQVREAKMTVIWTPPRLWTIISDGDGFFIVRYDTVRYDTRRYFNVRSKANMSQLNLPNGTDN